VARRFASAAARDRVVRRGRLRDRLAGAAGELLTHGLDHLMGARNAFQRLGNCLAELAQPAAATGTGCRRRQHHALARQMRRERCPHRPGSRERTHRRCPWLYQGSGNLVLGDGGLDLLELHLQLVERFRPRSAEAPRRSRWCRAIIRFRCVTIASAPAAPLFNSGDDLHRRHTRPCPFRRSYKRR
jgi:hypothetical protein